MDKVGTLYFQHNLFELYINVSNIQEVSHLYCINCYRSNNYMISLHQSRFHMFWALVEEIINPHAQKEKIFTDGVITL
jgi:hypothetical protein